MADMGFTPNLQAGGNIFPFRFVKLSTSADFTGLQASAEGDYPIGVTDGSIYQATVLNATGYHAISGTPITLQPSNTVQIEIGTGGVTRGGFLESDADGKGIAAAGTGAVSAYVALESGAAGDIIRAFRIGLRGPIFA